MFKVGDKVVFLDVTTSTLEEGIVTEITYGVYAVVVQLF